jgi:hypothetical protein
VTGAPHPNFRNVSDLRELQLVAAVRAIVADVERRVAREVVVARGVERLLTIIESEQRPAERIRRENTAALIEMAALGNTRDAAMQIAKRRSGDPHTRQMLAQRFRRLRRIKNKRAVFG